MSDVKEKYEAILRKNIQKFLDKKITQQECLVQSVRDTMEFLNSTTDEELGNFYLDVVGDDMCRMHQKMLKEKFGKEVSDIIWKSLN